MQTYPQKTIMGRVVDGALMQTYPQEAIMGLVVDGALMEVTTGFYGVIRAVAGGRVTVDAYFQTQGAPTEDDPSPVLNTLTLEDVPLKHRDFGGGWFARAQAIVGDRVWCSGSQRSIDEIGDWFESAGDAYATVSLRKLSHDDITAEVVGYGDPMGDAPGNAGSLVIFGHGASIELHPDGRILLNGGGPAVARVGDDVSSGPVQDAVFWTWLAAAAAVLAGLGVVAPIPTSLESKIITGSITVESR